MEIRTTVSPLALAALVVLAGCLGAAGSSPDDQQPNATVERAAGDGATIVVGGTGSVEAEPDAATVRLSVVATGESPDVVRTRLSRNTTAVREALLAYGLDEEQITSRHFRIEENHRARREGGEDEPPYVGTHALVVDLDDVDAVGEVIDVAVENASVQVEGVEFGLSDERQAQLRNQALTEAVEDARSEAELVAAAEELRVVAVERITTDRVQFDRPRATVVREAAATATPGGDASTRVQGGEVTVTASVQVVYNASGG